jgi:V/A-type H+-transporting ATPase subunit C
LQRLAALESVDAVLDALPSPWHQLLAGARDIPEIFARMEHAAATQARALLGSRAPAVARAFAYLILRERDLRGIRAVLRGRHLGLPPADIRNALRREPAEAV